MSRIFGGPAMRVTDAGSQDGGHKAVFKALALVAVGGCALAFGYVVGGSMDADALAMMACILIGMVIAGTVAAVALWSMDPMQPVERIEVMHIPYPAAWWPVSASAASTEVLEGNFTVRT